MWTVIPASSIACFGLTSSDCSKPFSVRIATLRSFRFAIQVMLRFNRTFKKNMPSAGLYRCVSTFNHELFRTLVHNRATLHFGYFNDLYAEILRDLSANLVESPSAEGVLADHAWKMNGVEHIAFTIQESAKLHWVFCLDRKSTRL